MSMSRGRRVLVVALIAGAIALLAVPAITVVNHVASQAVGVTTTVSSPDGGDRTVYWREYPAVAGLDADDLLNGPSVAEAYDAGTAMVADMREALTAEFGLKWADDPTQNDGNGPFFDRVQNGFGGQSLLTTINAPGSQSTSIPTSWADKERIIEIIGEVADAYGFDPPLLDHEVDRTTSTEDRIRDLGGATPETQVIVSGSVSGPTGQWLFFTLQDPSKDIDGRFAEQLRAGAEQGWQANTVTIGYGANALLPEDLRAEFEQKLQPFRGLAQPPALES